MARSLSGAAIAVRERAIRAVFDVRGNPGDAAFAAAVTRATGMALPAPNTFRAADERLIAWLGPDEFLVIDDRDDGDALERALRDRLAGVRSAVTATGSGYARLVVSGANAREFLARGCPLDLHPRAFGPGRCAQTHLAKAQVLLLMRDAAPVFEALVRRSYAGYLWSWLARHA